MFTVNPPKGPCGRRGVIGYSFGNELDVYRDGGHRSVGSTTAGVSLSSLADRTHDVIEGKVRVDAGHIER